jgi:hypothetical protein
VECIGAVDFSTVFPTRLSERVGAGLEICGTILAQKKRKRRRFRFFGKTHPP